jgi:purine-binding chemotaxis protein CheW
MGALVRTERQQARSAGYGNAVQKGRQYLTFLVVGEMFAIPISAIKEIIEYRIPTDVPMMPSFMRGVINLRGRVVPVIDLSARFGRGKGETTRRSCIVIVEIRHEEQQHDIGVAVDAVNAVLDIADADIEPAPTFGAKLRAEFISGMGKVAEKFVIILEIDKVLSVDELSALGGMGDEAGDPSGAVRAHQPAEAEAQAAP